MIETLTKARDLIADRGLGKHVFKDQKTGCLCTIGAVIEAVGHDASLGGYDDPAVESVAGALANTISTYGHVVHNRAHPTSDIYDWNDRDETTKTEVIKLFNDTIELVSQ